MHRRQRQQCIQKLVTQGETCARVLLHPRIPDGDVVVLQAVQPCPQTFTQAISDEGNLLFLSSAIRMGGFTNKLPDPSVGLTVFAPTNNALWKVLTAMNLGKVPDLGMAAV
jgi:hypothetical protein